MDKQRIVVIGASGLIGTALIQHLLTKTDYHIVALSRQTHKSDHPLLEWQVVDHYHPDELSSLIEGCQIVVNLAGESIASGRWTREKKQVLFNSRVTISRNVCQAISACSQKPHLYLQASAIGYYGHDDKIKTESSPAGPGFLAELCQAWEQVSESLPSIGVRRVICRFGIVLSKQGGILVKLTTPLRWGLGAVLGNGKQWVSWISSQDLSAAILHLITDNNLSGSFNICAPQPIQHRAFMEILAQSSHRPLFCRIPTFLIHWILGEMGDELLLASQRALPTRLRESGFQFSTPTLQQVFALTSQPHKIANRP